MSTSGVQMTPYASFNAMSNEIVQNGGAWYDSVPVFNSHSNPLLFPQYPNSTIIPHQTMGGVSDLIALTGSMAANIEIPSNLVQLNQNFTYTFTYTVCEVKPDGDTRAMGQFNGFSGLAVEWCPKISDMSHTSSMKLSNPWIVSVSSEASVPKLRFTTSYIGNIKLKVALSPSYDPIRPSPTIATFLSSTNAHSVTSTGSAAAAINSTGSPGTASTMTTVTSLSATLPTSSSSHNQAVESDSDGGGGGEGSSLDPNYSDSTTSSTSVQSKKANVTAIVGGTLGGLFFLTLNLFF